MNPGYFSMGFQVTMGALTAVLLVTFGVGVLMGLGKDDQ